MSGAARIDAHQHFWRLSRGDYAWLSADLTPLYRDFEPADLLPHLRQTGIVGTVLVSAAPTAAETRFLLELADANDLIAGVVGWFDMEAPDAARQLAELAEHPKLVGVRPMIQDLPDDEWMLRPALDAAYEAVIHRDLVFGALVLTRHLPHLATLVDRFPELRVVVDHGAKPEISAGVAGWRDYTAWRDGLEALARPGTAACKLSGLVTEAGRHWRWQNLRPFAETLVELFGSDRVLWGSDWPVVELAGGYEAWWNATECLLAGRSADERDAILGGNAGRVYRLGGRE